MDVDIAETNVERGLTEAEMNREILDGVWKYIEPYLGHAQDVSRQQGAGLFCFVFFRNTDKVELTYHKLGSESWNKLKEVMPLQAIESTYNPQIHFIVSINIPHPVLQEQIIGDIRMFYFTKDGVQSLE